MNRLARWTGIALQGLVLGALLFLALMKLFSLQAGARVFRYQGF